jgi:hypothetical protein
MKVRIQQDGIRFRLSDQDVNRLKGGSPLQEALIIGPDQRIVYAVRLEEADRIHLRYSDGKIEAVVPAETARLWLESQRIGLKTTVDNGSGGILITLEKDLDPRLKERTK